MKVYHCVRKDPGGFKKPQVVSRTSCIIAEANKYYIKYLTFRSIKFPQSKIKQKNAHKLGSQNTKGNKVQKVSKHQHKEEAL